MFIIINVLFCCFFGGYFVPDTYHTMLLLHTHRHIYRYTAGTCTYNYLYTISIELDSDRSSSDPIEHMSAAQGFGSFVSYNDSFFPLQHGVVCVDYITLKMHMCERIKYKISDG